MRTYDEATKLSDILGANLVPLPTRTVVVEGSQNYMIGSLMVAGLGPNAVFTLMTVNTQASQQVGVLGHYAVKPPNLQPTDDYTATLYFGGSFQADRLLVANETVPVDVRGRREYLLQHNIYLEG
jgi:hypothetical protein